MRVLIFGATGGTGRRLVSQGLEQGRQVTALVRDSGTLTSENSDLTIVKGGLSDRNSIASALNGANAVMSVLGNKTGNALFKPITVISRSLPAIISTMRQLRVDRLLFVN